jgi:Rod binding domain-containing protein
MSAIGAVSTQNQSATFPQSRLVQAAHEFEAQLMKELLKPLTNGSSADGKDEEPESGGPLADFATEALGQALSRQGGLGIATNILHSLSRNEKNAGSVSNAGTKEVVFRNAGAFRLK